MDSITTRLRRRQPSRISMNFGDFIERFYLVLQVLRRGVEDSRRPGPFGLQILSEKQEVRTREVTRTRPTDKMKIGGLRIIRYTEQEHAVII